GEIRLWLAAGTMFNEILLWRLPLLPSPAPGDRGSGSGRECPWLPPALGTTSVPCPPNKVRDDVVTRYPTTGNDCLEATSTASMAPDYGYGGYAAATANAAHGAPLHDTVPEWPYHAPSDGDRLMQLAARYAALDM
ncbi:hypothetical protein Vretifemale_6732, partial [Volvox reticuliferus]